MIEENSWTQTMTTFYPSQSTPSFLKKYTKTVYNRVQHDAHTNGHNASEEHSLHLQVSARTHFVEQVRVMNSLSGRKKLLNRKIPSAKNNPSSAEREARVKINISADSATFAKNNQSKW